MIFNDHYQRLGGKHAVLSPSQNAWLRYTEEKLTTVYDNRKLAELGTRLHALASEHINLSIKMPDNKQSLNAFVNDAIGFKMQSEVILYYSDFCFGTTDAIVATKSVPQEGPAENTLRISDYKSGNTPVSMDQLMVYASLYFLEYDERPMYYNVILRVYQFDEIKEYIPTAEEINACMNEIIDKNRMLEMIAINYQ